MRKRLVIVAPHPRVPHAGPSPDQGELTLAIPPALLPYVLFTQTPKSKPGPGIALPVIIQYRATFEERPR